MPRFIFESGCEKLAPAMVKGRLPAHVSAVLALLLLAAAGASAQTAPPTLGVLVNQVLALFPKVNGEVLEVQGTTLTLSLGQRDGLVAGVELTAYREGRELRHPKTGEILGRTEEVLGRVTVQRVQEAYATGAVVEGTDIRPGDKVRVSAGKIKLTLLPIVEGVRGDLAEAVTYELIEALNRSGRFQMALRDAVNVWLAAQGIRRQDVLEGRGLAQVAPRFKIENLLVVAFSRVQNKPTSTCVSSRSLGPTRSSPPRSSCRPRSRRPRRATSRPQANPKRARRQTRCGRCSRGSSRATSTPGRTRAARPRCR